MSPNTSLSIIPERDHSPISSRECSHDSITMSRAISIDSTINFEDQFCTPPLTPSSESSVPSYIVDAAHHITQAVEFEIAKKYELSFAAYKEGIDILLRNMKCKSNLGILKCNVLYLKVECSSL